MRVLDTFLYEAIFIPEGFEPPPKDIIKEPELQVYVDEFGSKIVLLQKLMGKLSAQCGLALWKTSVM